MPRSMHLPTLITALVLATTPALAQECADDCELASGYLTFSGQYRVGSAQYDKDITAFVGWLAPHGRDGAWMLRAEAGGGISMYTPDARNFGYLGGAQLSVVRVWTGDYLGLNDTLPIELFVTAGSGLFAGWDLEDSPDETVLIPTLMGGLGVRGRSNEPGAMLISIELLGEESMGDRGGRAFLRFSIGWAR